VYSYVCIYVYYCTSFIINYNNSDPMMCFVTVREHVISIIVNISDKIVVQF